MIITRLRSTTLDYSSAAGPYGTRRAGSRLRSHRRRESDAGPHRSVRSSISWLNRWDSLPHGPNGVPTCGSWGGHRRRPQTVSLGFFGPNRCRTRRTALFGAGRGADKSSSSIRLPARQRVSDTTLASPTLIIVPMAAPADPWGVVV